MRSLAFIVITLFPMSQYSAEAQVTDSTISLCQTTLQNSLIAEASETYGRLCTISQEQFCTWLVNGFSENPQPCTDGKYSDERQWYVSVIRINTIDRVEFAIQMVGPSSKMSGYKKEGFERHKIRFYITVGFAGQPIAIPFFHDPRYNTSDQIKNAFAQGNPNNRIFDDANAIETLYAKFQKAVAQGIVDHYWGVGK